MSGSTRWTRRNRTYALLLPFASLLKTSSVAGDGWGIVYRSDRNRVVDAEEEDNQKYGKTVQRVERPHD